MRLIAVLIGIVLLAAVFWVVAGYFSTMPLGAVYGWSGHPSIPAAPTVVYVMVYLVILPVLSVSVAWRLLWRFARSGQRHG